MRKVVLDTNVIVSALIVPVGKSAQILKHINDLDLQTSEEILSEVERVLHYPRIQRRYQLSDETIHTYLERLKAVSTIVAVHSQVEAVVRDPDDNKFLACAIDGGAEYLVSGDPDLTVLAEYQGIQIVTPAAFLDVLAQDTGSE